ncbi:SMP-30/gluconolactonase/LRE family protein [Rubrivirga marina]|uniref:SMP-30/Gluconolactonase/LRE-like region domain-containing protein n=1 Tax=Rubrivirga marina TaxID=1196024 RepID=A0A271IYX5_9BACT|nr:SMP-30/gluconolactonase/LRE family protein [Rubrivirga marina]PAP75709.1 hypothetical protein BSZ37_04280 [Rubrivirga marina]
MRPLLLVAAVLAASASAQPDLGAFTAHADVGDVRTPGTVAYSPASATYTISGSGTNMWATSDEFHLVYRRMTGDFVLTADMAFVGEGVDPHRKIGWIARASLDPGAPYVDAALHGDGLMSLQYRAAAGDSTVQVVSDSSASTVRLARRGGVYSMSVARAGEPFTTVELTEPVDLGDEVLVGLFVCAHNPDVVETAVFSNVRVAVPVTSGIGDLVPADAEVEVLAEGFTWSEGPVWRPAEGDLLFSDVPENVVYRWSESDGLSAFLRPASRAFGSATPGEAGSNGLILDADGRLLLAEHGTRAVMRLGDRFVRDTLAARYDGRRLNSPNDLVLHSSGALFFTDPPYGLAGQDGSPQKELPFNGVYRLDSDGTVTLIDDGLSRPNGIVLSPDERTLLVANSDPARAIWMAYPVAEDGSVGEGTVLFDATEWVGPDRPGLPDGMAVDADGNVFATGPGGVLVFSAAGEYLGTIETEKATANVAFGDADGRALYLTSSDQLLRLRVATRGLGF